jgi:hypothetical protein
MDKVAKKKKQTQAHKNRLKEEFGPEFGDPNAAKAFEGAIESRNKSKNKKC